MLFVIEGEVALDRNLGPGHNNLLLRLIPGEIYSAYHHKLFHTPPGLLHSWVALPNPTLMPVCQAGRDFVPF